MMTCVECNGEGGWWIYDKETRQWDWNVCTECKGTKEVGYDGGVERGADSANG